MSQDKGLSLRDQAFIVGHWVKFEQAEAEKKVQNLELRHILKSET